jgi:hypothetical protein
MSLRELRVLVANLPPDSATARAYRGHNWGDIEYMIAEILDVVKYHRVEWAYSKGAKPPKPKPTNRPTTPDRSTSTTNGASNGTRVISDRDLAYAAHEHVLEQLGIDHPEHPSADPSVTAGR